MPQIQIYGTLPSGGTGDYNQLNNKPSINNVELSGNKSLEDLGINMPTNTSDLTNDSNFISSTLITSFWEGTQDEFDNLSDYDSTTLYLIEEEV